MNYMDLALEEAEKAKKLGEVPVGAVIVNRNGEIISKAHNLKETKQSPIAHAEILAIEEACKMVGSWRLNGAEMYVTLEPCPMCAAAIAQSRISKVHIGTFSADMGACGGVFNILDYPVYNHYVDIQWKYDDRCSDILTKFFKSRRKKNNGGEENESSSL